MTELEAKDVIKQAIGIAQKSGAYSIKDAALIYQALLTLGYIDTESEATHNQDPEVRQPESEGAAEHTV